MRVFYNAFYYLYLFVITVLIINGIYKALPKTLDISSPMILQS